jgi:hypothetical protein
MLTWDFDVADRPVAEAEFKRPAAYLDHWAVMEIAVMPASRHVLLIR